MTGDYHSYIRPAARSDTARICANCAHWVPDDIYLKWGKCQIGLNHGTFHNHRTGSCECKHTNTRYRSQKGCKVRFRWKNQKLQDA